MSEQPHSIIERFFGLNWRTTIGGAMAAAGGVMAASCPPGQWQVAGQVIGAVGVACLGLASRDRVVSTAQMDAAKPDTKPLPAVPEIKQP